MAWSVYIRVKFRALGVTWATEVWHIGIWDGRKFAVKLDRVPPGSEKVFDRWGVSVFAPPAK